MTATEFKERLWIISGYNLATRVAKLFDAIAHGDEKHREWLEKAIQDHMTGDPVEKETK